MMSELQTSFAGLHLNNPIIIGSSGLTDKADKVVKLAQAGAGAVVLKSLFEEQIMRETVRLQPSVYHTEGNEYLWEYLRSYKLSGYLDLIRQSKEGCFIPVIASINCHTASEWVSFAKEIEKAGADALEINILALPADAQYEYGSFEQHYIDVLKKVKEHVSIPVIMKLGNNLTNPVALISQLYANGASAIVLFNRFYRPDIDIDKMTQTTGEVFGTLSELAGSLRWIGIASSAIDRIDYAASGGVHTPQAVIKAILAGASAVEICSVIYKNGNEEIELMKRFLKMWMKSKGFESIALFKGKLKVKDLQGVNTFERTQFLKYYGMKE